jgi:hypothetical protein
LPGEKSNFFQDFLRGIFSDKLMGGSLQIFRLFLNLKKS